MKVLVAGVGYQNLRDLSIGSLLVSELGRFTWPDSIELYDLSYGPIAVVQWLETRPAYYDRMVFFTGIERGRAPGTVHAYRRDCALPPPEEIQQRIGEAVMGVISLDNLLVITQFFRVLSPEVRVIEIEPQDTGWGLGLSAPVEAALPPALLAIRDVALEGLLHPADLHNA